MKFVSRDILTATPRGRREVRELLQGIFVAELLCPSEALWIVSPWISDIPVIDDHAGRFRFLHNSGQTTVRLTQVIEALAKKGTRIKIVTRSDPTNEAFLHFTRSWASDGENLDVTVGIGDTVHAKGLSGDQYSLSGSMNLTWHGTQKWDELVHFRSGAGASELRLKFEEAYG